MKTISTNLLDSGKVAELGLCPICKVNYITEDETVCSTCYADTDLTDDEIMAMYGEKESVDDDDDDDTGDDEGLNPVDDDDLTLAEDDDLELLNVAGIDNEDDDELSEDDDEDMVDPLEEDFDDDDELDDDDFDLDDEDDDDDDDEDKDWRLGWRAGHSGLVAGWSFVFFLAVSNFSKPVFNLRLVFTKQQK